MTNENKLNKNNCLNNTLLVENKIKLKIYKGDIYGNIIETTPVQCELEGFVFTCEENSQYIPLI